MHIHLPDRVIDLERRVVRCVDGDVVLTELEVALLAYLVGRPDQPVGRDELLLAVWKYPKPVATRCVDTAVRRLRQKIEPQPGRPNHLLKVHGLGYRFVPNAPYPTPAPLDPTRTDLPESPVLVGREALIRYIGGCILRGPVVTVVGPPGVGTTAVAMAAARHVGGDFVQGVWNVGTTSEDPGPGALWVRDRAAPMACEAHQLYARTGPTGLPGETVVVVPALTKPQVRALLEQWRVHAESLGSILARIGGLPGPLRALGDQLERMSAGELQAQIEDGSVTLCSTEFDGVPNVISALAAFRSPWRASDATDLTGDGDLALSSLVERGLLQHDSDGYWVPFTVRAGLPIIEEAHRLAHLRWFTTWARRTLGQQASFEMLSARSADLEAALNTALEGGGDPTLELLCMLNPFIRARWSLVETLTWLERGLECAISRALRARGYGQWAEALRQDSRLAEAHEALDQGEALGVVEEQGYLEGVRATVLHTEVRREEALAAYLRAASLEVEGNSERACILLGEAALLTIRLGRPDEGEALSRRALAEAVRIGDQRLLGRCEGRLGRVLAHRGWHWESLPRLASAVRICREHGDRLNLGFSLFVLGDSQIDAGLLEVAEKNLREAAAVATETGVVVLRSMCESGVALTQLLRGCPELAKPLLESSIRGYHDADQPGRTAYPLGWAAVCYADLGDHKLAQAALARASVIAGAEPLRHALWTLFDGLVGFASNGDVTRAEALVIAGRNHSAQAYNSDIRVALQLLESRILG